ncbi:MAG: hypothetical protein P4L99_11080 [Chthoniobacter sp.]|nr:hypothetical protein [Chthoniobacter sp.]
MNSPRRLNPLRELSPGEIAFDRCMLLIVLSLVYGSVSHFLQPLALHVRLLPVLLPFVFGLVLAFFWVRAFHRLVDSWSDPVVCILRFCSLVLLSGQALAVCGLFLDSVMKLVGLLFGH